MQTLYSNTITALSTTMGEIYVVPIEKFKVFTPWGFLNSVANPPHLNDSGNEKMALGVGGIGDHPHSTI